MVESKELAPIPSMIAVPADKGDAMGAIHTTTKQAPTFILGDEEYGFDAQRK